MNNLFFFSYLLEKNKQLCYVFKYWENGNKFVAATSVRNLLLNYQKRFLG